MFFNNITGQEVLKSRLIQTVKDNRVSHAWLLFGAEGSGALPIALAFANYILCTNRTDEDSCGLCSSCNKTSKLIHPDLHFVFPVNKTKSSEKESVTCDDFISDWRNFMQKNPYGRLAQWYEVIDLENKQGVISTEDSKKLAGKLFLKSFESDYKVVIIWQPEKMNDQASNKLLKLLEEPPPMTVFILVSESPDLLLSTIRSRCIHVKVPRIEDKALKECLIEKHNLTDQKALEVTRLADGSYLKALEILSENNDPEYNFLKFRDLMRSCFKASIPELMDHAEELAGLMREKQKSFLEYALYIVRESLAFHFDEADLVFVSGEEKTFTPNFAPFINGNNIISITSEITRAIHDIERNANGRIVFLDLALKLSSLIKK